MTTPDILRGKPGLKLSDVDWSKISKGKPLTAQAKAKLFTSVWASTKPTQPGPPWRPWQKRKRSGDDDTNVGAGYDGAAVAAASQSSRCAEELSGTNVVAPYVCTFSHHNNDETKLLKD